MESTIIHYLYHAIGIKFFCLYTLVSMIIRGTIIYLLGTIIGRFNKKLFSIRTPFNTILFIMLGSIFAQSVIDEKLFISIVLCALFLILFNGFISMLTFMFPSIEQFIKGKPSTIVKDGEIQWEAMRKNFITKNELYNELQKQLHTNNLKIISEAFLAYNGTINFIEKTPKDSSF